MFVCGWGFIDLCVLRFRVTDKCMCFFNLGDGIHSSHGYIASRREGEDLQAPLSRRISYLPLHFSCTSGNPPGAHIAALYYVGGLYVYPSYKPCDRFSCTCSHSVFDVVTMGITSTYLWKFSSSSRSSSVSLDCALCSQQFKWSTDSASLQA